MKTAPPSKQPLSMLAVSGMNTAAGGTHPFLPFLPSHPGSTPPLTSPPPPPPAQRERERERERESLVFIEKNRNDGTS